MTSSYGRPPRIPLGDPFEQLDGCGAARDRCRRPARWRRAARGSGPEGAGPLEGQHVERLLDDTQAIVVARGVEADGAQRPGADVEAALAEDDLVADRHERRRERASLRLGGAQQVIGQPLRGLGADAGQSRERLDEPGDRLDELLRRHDWAVELHAGDLEAAGHAGHACSSASCAALVSASPTAATTRSWSISTSSGSTTSGSMVDRHDLLLAGHDGLDDTTTGAALDVQRPASSCSTRAMSACICCAILARLPMPTLVLLLLSSRCPRPRPAPPRRCASPGRRGRLRRSRRARRAPGWSPRSVPPPGGR